MSKSLNPTSNNSFFCTSSINPGTFFGIGLGALSGSNINSLFLYPLAKQCFPYHKLGYIELIAKTGGAAVGAYYGNELYDDLTLIGKAVNVDITE